MDVPETRYARSGDVNIAYQVAGAGPFDVVFVPGYVSHVELGWETPRHGDLRRRLASFARLIVFDKRGTGMSDPVDGVPSLETRMDDLRGVMDAAGSKRAAIIGLEEGVPMSVLFAATYPERTAALVLWGGYARAMWAPDYPWGWTAEAYRGLLEADLELFGPRDKAVDLFTRRFGEGPAENVDYYRHCVSPSMMIALNRMNAEIDVRPVLPAIRVPTLVIHGDSDRAVAELGLEIRAGLHTGECELLDGKVTGIAVSIGARVAAEAGPGEVLVSSTVKDLVAGSGLEFEDRGLHELKGVPGEWRLYSVATRA